MIPTGQGARTVLRELVIRHRGGGPTLPGAFAPGDPLRAADMNLIVEAVRDQLLAERLATGEGTRAAVIGRDWPAVIKKVNVPAGQEGQPVLPSEVTYDVRILDRGDIGTEVGLPNDKTEWQILGMTPRLGRPVKNDEIQIHPCAVNDPCTIRLQPVADPLRNYEPLLWVHTEAASWGDCATSAAASQEQGEAAA